MNELVGRGHEAVGSDIQSAYAGIQDNSAVVSAPYVQLDIMDRDAVARTIEEIKPDAIIHCAAWTNVDGAEDPANREKVHAINALGTQYIADAAKAIDAKIVNIRPVRKTASTPDLKSKASTGQKGGCDERYCISWREWNPLLSAHQSNI